MSGKKAEQRKVKEEKQEAARHRAKRTALFVKGGVTLLVVLALFVFGQGLFLGTRTLPPDLIGSNDHVMGNPDGAVTMTIYADFECPACGRQTAIIDSAWPQISEMTQLIFRHYPLDSHRNAFLAARYAEAATLQDAFWPMHDVIYRNQSLWSILLDPTELFDRYARELGLDVIKLKADAELPAVRDKILADQRGGTQAGVRATPTIYLNNRMVENPGTANELVELIKKAAAAG